MAINTKYFDNLNKELEQINTCPALAAFSEKFIAVTQPVIDKINENIAKLQTLITPPTTLPQVIAWIKSLIDTYLEPYNTMIVELAEYQAQILKTLNLLTQKINNLGCEIVNVADGGTGYVPGDQVSVVEVGASGKVLIVMAVDTGGVVKSLMTKTPGTGYHAGNWGTSAITGNGEGLVVILT